MGTLRNRDPGGQTSSIIFSSQSPTIPLHPTDDSADETERAIKILNSISSSYPPLPPFNEDEDESMDGITSYETAATEKVSNWTVTLDRLTKDSVCQINDNSLCVIT